MSDQTICAVAWFNREEWTRLKAVAADKDALDETYEDWLKGAVELLIELPEAGITVERVDVRVDELLEWCRRNKRKLDGEARSEYAAFKIRGMNLD